ncbi:uncharacterized protein LOC141657037 [Silene latifolia]|uniref:uncharacterized protein LOC141657037 n=1 Tax=Silene latifolia TaxID=37657 RepID=UPI003D787616
MGQIEKRRKKGRPSKADLEARRAVKEEEESPARETAAEREVRRSLRRKTFRYNIIDYDEDYLDDSDFFEEKRYAGADVEDDVDGDDDVEDEVDVRRRRREKKVKLVGKIDGGSKKEVTRPSRRGRVDDEDDDDDVEEREREREVKKRRRNASVEEDEDEDGDEDDDVDDVDNGGNDVDEEGSDGRREGRKMDGSNAPGTPSKENGDVEINEGPTPLPDKKQLEIILDKLQKKDTYGVYSEPVDPEELPDYHEVIEHPMDFSTVRKKLADGCYSTLEEFESDIFLISSNAMQYNASDTVYHKQARAIKELAERKFQRVRVRIQRSEPKSEPKIEPKLEVKSEQKDRSCSVTKRQIKKQLWNGMQEPLGSDFSSGATLATEDVHNSCGADLVSNHDRPSIHDGPLEGVPSIVDSSMERVEDPQSGKGALPKFGKKLFVVDENRRGTYNTSNLPVERPDSVFTTFESDKKQLIPVGLSGEYAYARSLARFAGNLGPIAWRIASKRIEQLLPPDFKYGRGWIGEVEPLPTALLFVGQHKDPFIAKSRNFVDSGRHNKNPEGQVAVPSHLSNQPTFTTKVAKSPIVNASAPQYSIRPHHAPGIPSNMTPKRVESSCLPSNDQKPSAIFTQQMRVESSCLPSNDQKRSAIFQQQMRVESNCLPSNDQKPSAIFQQQMRADSNCLPSNDQKPSAIFQQQMRVPKNTPCPETTGVRRMEPNTQALSDHKKDNVPQRQLLQGVEVRRSAEPCSPSVANQNQNLNNIYRKEHPGMDIPASRLAVPPFGQPEGNGHAHGASNGKTGNKFVDTSRATTSPGPHMSFPRSPDQSLNDPVLVMKMLSEKAQRQQNGPVSVHPQSPSVPSPRAGPGGNAANTWMSVGAAGFRPPAQNPFSNTSQMSSDALYNGTRVFYPQAMQSRETMKFQPEKNGLPFQAFASNQAPVSNRPTGFAHLANNDLSRFQVQTPWRGLSPHTEPKQKQKQDTLPPDLNVAFQSSVDSQQPDLALQL